MTITQIGIDIGKYTFYQRSQIKTQLGPASAKLVGDAAPSLACLFAVGLIEGLADRCCDDRVLAT